VRSLEARLAEVVIEEENAISRLVSEGVADDANKGLLSLIVIVYYFVYLSDH
jgi:hypothetical protein